MSMWITIGAVTAAALLSLLFSTLTYSLRDFSRAKLEDYLQRHGKSEWFEKTVRLTDDLTIVTAIGRLVANLLILVGVLHFLTQYAWSEWLRYLVAVVVTGLITLFSSVAVPHALSQHAGEKIIGLHVRTLHRLRSVLQPAIRLMHAIDRSIAVVLGVAGPASADKEYGAIPKGGTGFAVATIVEYLVARS